MQEHILRNAIITPDGTYLESFHRHDYKSHEDSLTGELYIVDGGYQYIRRSANKVPAQDLTVTTSDPFTLQRRAFTWGSYGKMQDQQKHYIFLCDLTEDHIYAILRNEGWTKGSYVEDLLKSELAYRKGEI